MCFAQSWIAMLFDEVIGNYELLDLRSSFVDFSNSGIPEIPLCRQVCHIAHPTQNLDSLTRDPGGCL